ncbi:MAG TPA: hypothetical protein EYH04_03755 [Archaeoglobus profundus]|nr:hypothetical protein [Archaeoglobus profundus]
MKEVGIISSNPIKMKILELLKKRDEVDIKVISKSIRIPEFLLKPILNDLKREGFITEENGLFKLSPRGLNVLLKKYDIERV